MLPLDKLENVHAMGEAILENSLLIQKMQKALNDSYEREESLVKDIAKLAAQCLAAEALSIAAESIRPEHMTIAFKHALYTFRKSCEWPSN